MTWSEKATVAAFIGLLALPTPILADKFEMIVAQAIFCLAVEPF